MVKCPRCGKHDVTLINNSHYICNDEKCVNENGERTQFQIVEDEKIGFPYNQIFVNRQKFEFFRTPYLKLKNIGTIEI